MKLNATEELLQQVCYLFYKLMSNNRSALHLRHVRVVSIKGIDFRKMKTNM